MNLRRSPDANWAINRKGKMITLAHWIVSLNGVDVATVFQVLSRGGKPWYVRSLGELKIARGGPYCKRTEATDAIQRAMEVGLKTE